jgi:tetratricopeptide (TPR) repeat protein
MIWALAAASAAILFFLYFNRPSRLVITLSSAAHNATTKKDWATAKKFLTLAREKAGKLKEPLLSQMTAVVELQWGTVLYLQGNFEEAEEMLRQGLVKARAALAPGANVLMYGDVAWGELCTDSGRHAEAEVIYRRVLAVDEERGNIGGAIFDLQRVADCLIRQDRRVEAMCEIRRAMDMEASIVKGNPISMCLPDLVFCREEYEEARKLYREKVEYWQQQANVPEQIDVGRLQMRLAISEARTGHAAEANEMFTRAAATYEQTLGANHPKVAAARVYLTDSLLKAGANA